jgi:hypothetical protein
MAVLVKTNRRVTLAERPVGFPKDSDFAIDEFGRSGSPSIRISAVE